MTHAGIVLMLGEVDTNTLVWRQCIYGFECVHTHLNILQSTFEAQYLANQVQLYYGTNQPDRFALAKQFNHNPQNFDYNTVLDQLQNTDIKRERETQSETW